MSRITSTPPIYTSGLDTGTKVVRIQPISVLADRADDTQRRIERGNTINRPSTPYNRIEIDSSDEEETQDRRRIEQKSSSFSDGPNGEGRNRRDKKITSFGNGIKVDGVDGRNRRRRRRPGSSSVRSYAESVASLNSGSDNTLRVRSTDVGRVVGTVIGGGNTMIQSEDEDEDEDERVSRGHHRPAHHAGALGPGKSIMRTPKVYHPAPSTILTTNLPRPLGNRHDSWKPLPPSPNEEAGSMNDFSPTLYTPRGLLSMSSLRRNLPPLNSYERATPSFSDKIKRRTSNAFKAGFSPLPGDPRSHSNSRASPSIFPADDLFTYLRYAQIPKWTKWIDPDLVLGGESRFGSQQSLFWSKRKGVIGGLQGSGDVPQGRAAVMNRLINDIIKNDQENGNPDREIRSWEPRKGFYEMIGEYIEKNVTRYPIEECNQWGDRLFVLPSAGFTTVSYHDPAADRAEDAGLLGWITGAILKTATSALQLLRHNAAPFTFHVIPDSVAPLRTTGSDGVHHFQRSNAGKAHMTELPDGCGTLVCLNSQEPTDRAMVMLVRPPWLIGAREMRNFAKGVRRWHSVPHEDLGREENQARLLQMQVYDECLENDCFFFCVTTLKHWVFGHFNSSYTRCSVSPVMNRKSGGPSVMQTLTVWLTRALDERPRNDTPTEPNNSSAIARTHPRSPLTPPMSPTPTFTLSSSRDIIAPPIEYRRPFYTHYASPYDQPMRSGSVDTNSANVPQRPSYDAMSGYPVTQCQRQPPMTPVEYAYATQGGSRDRCHQGPYSPASSRNAGYDTSRPMHMFQPLTEYMQSQETWTQDVNRNPMDVYSRAMSFYYPGLSGYA